MMEPWCAECRSQCCSSVNLGFDFPRPPYSHGAPYRVRNGKVSADVYRQTGAWPSKNDMGGSRNGIARSADQAKLPTVDHFDYIIVGAGSAGCVLADRLSADGRHRVLVLEAGGSDARFWIKTPIGYGRTFADAAVNWKYQTLPNPGLNGRSIYWPRGPVLGGSGSM